MRLNLFLRYLDISLILFFVLASIALNSLSELTLVFTILLFPLGAYKSEREINFKFLKKFFPKTKVDLGGLTIFFIYEKIDLIIIPLVSGVLFLLIAFSIGWRDYFLILSAVSFILCILNLMVKNKLLLIRTNQVAYLMMVLLLLFYLATFFIGEIVLFEGKFLSEVPSIVGTIPVILVLFLYLLIKNIVLDTKKV